MKTLIALMSVIVVLITANAYPQEKGFQYIIDNGFIDGLAGVCVIERFIGVFHVVSTRSGWEIVKF